jgi:hypothetical protein
MSEELLSSVIVHRCNLISSAEVHVLHVELYIFQNLPTIVQFYTFLQHLNGLPFINTYWVPGELSLGAKQSGHEADCSPPSDAKVKNE